MSWNHALIDYARTKDPQTLPDEVLLMCTKHTLTIFDKYPKAKFHFLTLPRLPLLEPASGTEILQPTLNSLAALLSSRHALPVLKLLKEASDEVKEQLEDEMVKQEGFTWPIAVGFHAIESMAHVHLHIISQDYISNSLKNKKHWNSFNPKHGFFLHLRDIIDWVENRTLKQHNKSKREYEGLLKSELRCHLCDIVLQTIPSLKMHLEKHFADYKDTYKARNKRKIEAEPAVEEAMADATESRKKSKHDMSRLQSNVAE